MSAEPARTFPHNTLWRKLRRRYFFDRFSLFGALFGCPPVLCSLSWLLHGPLWFTLCWGAVWLLTSMFMTFVMAMSLMARARRDTPPLRSLPVRFSLLWTVLIHGATLVALLMGRVDWAFYLVFGISGLSALWSGHKVSLQTALHLTIGLALCLAFALQANGMVILLFLLQLVPSGRLRPALQERIRSLPTRTEYVARSREACAAGGG